jgi:uncharacterized protein
MEKKRFFVHEPASAGTLRDVLLILWHGAGGDVDERSILEVCRDAAEHGAIAARAHFPYRLAGRKAPDRMPVLIESAKSAIAEIRAATSAHTKKLVLGGRSMGGRVASMLAAGGHAVDGLVFLSYPLHPAGKKDQLRDAHLPDIASPMLFVQGDRDDLCDLTLLEPVLARLGERAELALFPGNDHSMRKVAQGKIAEAVRGWLERRVGANVGANDGA